MMGYMVIWQLLQRSYFMFGQQASCPGAWQQQQRD
jgi:hypothetical protein